MFWSRSLRWPSKGLAAGSAVLPSRLNPHDPQFADHTWVWRNTESSEATSGSGDTAGLGREPRAWLILRDIWVWLTALSASLTKPPLCPERKKLLRNLMAASLWGVIQIASVARQKHSHSSVKKEKLIQAWVGNGGDGDTQDYRGMGRLSTRCVAGVVPGPFPEFLHRVSPRSAMGRRRFSMLPLSKLRQVAQLWGQRTIFRGPKSGKDFGTPLCPLAIQCNLINTTT